MHCKVVLKEDVPKVGKAGEVVQVSGGYARNFLLPHKLALAATPANIRRYEEYQRTVTKKRDQERQQAEKLALRLEHVSCTIAVQAHEEQLYGAVTNADIAAALAVEGIEIDKKDIILEEPIKALGVYQVPVKLHADVRAQVKVWVVEK